MSLWSGVIIKDKPHLNVYTVERIDGWMDGWMKGKVEQNWNSLP